MHAYITEDFLLQIRPQKEVIQSLIVCHLYILDTTTALLLGTQTNSFG